MKNIIRSIRLLLSSNNGRVNIYREMGVHIGKSPRLLGKIDFGSEPYLVRIGDDVTITNGVLFLTHDGAVGLFRNEYPGMNVYAPINIGNRIFIGNRAILMPGVTIGDDSIIGAGSLVNKDIPSGSVAAGVPARIIRSTEEYKNKIMSKAIFIDSSNPSLLKEVIMRKFPTRLNAL